MNLLEEIRAFRELVLRKQDRLTPGDYIIIENDVISADLSRVDDVENDIRDLKTGYAAVIAKNLQQDTALANHETRLIDAEGDIDNLESGLSDLEEKVDNIHGFDIVPLGEGDYDPETGIPTIENPKNNTLYLVPNLAEEDQKNLWIEWLWIQSKWEQFGAASIDMNNYVKKTDYATASKTGVVKIKQFGGLTVGSNGDLSVSPATVGDISTYTRNPLPITPSTAPDAVYYGLGRIARSAYTYSEQDKNNIRQLLGATGVVADVRLDGASVLDSYGIARIPLATAGQKGVVRARSAESSPYNYGIDIPATGTPEIVPAVHSQIKGAPPEHTIKSPIVPGTQHEAVFYGLAKAAGDVTQQGAPDSEFPVGIYTPPAITAIQQMIGIGPATDETAGLVKASNIGGIDVDESGSLGLYPATQANITGRTFGQRPITPENFDFAVKAALTDGIGAEWTSAEKAAARERIGAGQGGGGVTDVTVDDVSVVDPETGIAAIDTSDFGKVKDVQIGDISIVDETTGVASIPYATATQLGLVKWTNTNNGLDSYGNGNIYVCGATSSEIESRANVKKVINPTNLDFAVKAALTDGVGPAYTTAEQTAARTRLGVDYPVKDVKIGDTSIVDPNTGAASIPISNGSRYGVIKVYASDDSSQGIVKDSSGVIHVAPMITPISTARLSNAKRKGEVVTGNVLDAAVKAALTDGVGPAYTTEEQTAARTRLGVEYPVKGVKVNNVDVVDSNGVANITVGQLGGVDDVQIAHNSIVDDYGVAQIPYATYSNLGMVRPYSNEYASGLYINTYSGDLSISPATLSMIQAAPPDTDVKCPIIPANQHQAVFYGLAKAAGDTYQGGSGYPVGSYIPPAKTAIQEMIGLKIVTQAQYDAIVGADSDGNIYFITED